MDNKNFGRQVNALHGEKFRKDYLPIPDETERIASIVVDAAYAVHKTLGTGLLESVYETCFCYELQKRGLKFERQVGVPIIYDGHRLDENLRLDVIVAD
jgi:hypothetical protein